MNDITNSNTKKSEKSKKVLDIIKKILLYTFVAVASIMVLCFLYKVIQYLFVGAILFIAWLFPFRR